MFMKKIVFVVEKTTTGFSAYAEDSRKYTVRTTSDTMDDLKINILDAINVYLKALNEKQVIEDQIIIKTVFQ
jgi:hypothetical protein